MKKWSTRLAAAGLAACASLSMTGCATDRSAEAAELRPVVQALPGVASSDVRYINDF